VLFFYLLDLYSVVYILQGPCKVAQLKYPSSKFAKFWQ